MSSNLKQRFIVALALVVPLLGLLIYYPQIATLLVLLLAFFCWHELSKIFKLKKQQTVLGFVLLATLLVWTSQFGPIPNVFFPFLLLLSFLSVLTENGPADLIWRSLYRFFIGFAYIFALFAFIDPILSLPNGNFLLLFSLGVLFCSDIAAYFVGKSIGGKKLCPAISPAKTWSGFLGANFCAWLFGALVFLYISPNLLGFSFPAFPTLLSIALLPSLGLFGDLFESLIKRKMQIKDSGSALPGHGGWLDRLDSLLFSLPWVYLCYTIF